LDDLPFLTFIRARLGLIYFDSDKDSSHIAGEKPVPLLLVNNIAILADSGPGNTAVDKTKAFTVKREFGDPLVTLIKS
jgi:hypothetical protein